MIFKSLHENLVKKKINKSLELLNNQTRIKPNPIKTIGCIIDPMFPVEVSNFIKLVHRIGLKEKDLKLITFQENDNGFNISGSQDKISAWKDIWSAGQGVGFSNRVQALESVVTELENEWKVNKT